MQLIRDRLEGCLFGLAIGDAIGAPVEFMKRGSFAEVTGYQNGGKFRLQAGEWTDDTAISLAASTALFDYDGDGVAENTAWIESTDALLVNDINQDGIINDASELFGNYTRNSDGSVAKSGYQALSYYDTNGDSVIDASDTRFEELKLWIDSNQDGVTDTGELKTLSEMGVTSLKLNGVTLYIPTTENTNTVIQETAFTDASGCTPPSKVDHL